MKPGKTAGTSVTVPVNEGATFGQSNGESSARRQVLSAIGAAFVVSPLAGCLGDDVDDPGNDDGNFEEIDDYLSDANGWEGELQDHRGEDSLTIDVGDPDGGNNYQFNPIAPEIDVGTEVTWEWIDNASHSVTALDGTFDSGVHADYTFDYTVESPGTILYECQPHRAIGHLGALVVHE